MPIQRAYLAGLLTAACLIAAPVAAFAAPVSYDEAVNGDFSSTPANRTALGPFDIGRNTLLGSMLDVGPAGEDVMDTFTFVIQAGQQLTNIIVSHFDATGFPSGANIFMLNAAQVSMGSVNTVNRNIANGDDLLVEFGLGVIGPGTYSFDMRSFSAQFGLLSYGLNFDVVDSNAQLVPEPETLALVLLALPALAFATTRRKRKPAR